MNALCDDRSPWDDIRISRNGNGDHDGRKGEEWKRTKSNGTGMDREKGEEEKEGEGG